MRRHLQHTTLPFSSNHQDVSSTYNLTLSGSANRQIMAKNETSPHKLRGKLIVESVAPHSRSSTEAAPIRAVHQWMKPRLTVYLFNYRHGNIN
jgi:hypothetical protein